MPKKEQSLKSVIESIIPEDTTIFIDDSETIHIVNNKENEDSSEEKLVLEGDSLCIKM